MEKLRLVGLTGLEKRALRALGGPAAAGGGGPRARARAAGPALRRAAFQPRRQAAPARARGHPRTAAEPQPHRRLRDPRPGGGARGVRPDHRDVERPHRADGTARALRGAGRPVRGRLHRRCQHPDRYRRGSDRPAGAVQIGRLMWTCPIAAWIGPREARRPAGCHSHRRHGLPSRRDRGPRSGSLLSGHAGGIRGRESDRRAVRGSVRPQEPMAAGTPVSISFALQRGVAIIPALGSDGSLVREC